MKLIMEQGESPKIAEPNEVRTETSKPVATEETLRDTIQRLQTIVRQLQQVQIQAQEKEKD